MRAGGEANPSRAHHSRFRGTQSGGSLALPPPPFRMDSAGMPPPMRMSGPMSGPMGVLSGRPPLDGMDAPELPPLIPGIPGRMMMMDPAARMRRSSTHSSNVSFGRRSSVSRSRSSLRRPDPSAAMMNVNPGLTHPRMPGEGRSSSILPSKSDRRRLVKNSPIRRRNRGGGIAAKMAHNRDNEAVRSRSDRSTKRMAVSGSAGVGNVNAKNRSNNKSTTSSSSSITDVFVTRTLLIMGDFRGSTKASIERYLQWFVATYASGPISNSHSSSGISSSSADEAVSSNTTALGRSAAVHSAKSSAMKRKKRKHRVEDEGSLSGSSAGDGGFSLTTYANPMCSLMKNDHHHCAEGAVVCPKSGQTMAEHLLNFITVRFRSTRKCRQIAHSMRQQSEIAISEGLIDSLLYRHSGKDDRNAVADVEIEEEQKSSGLVIKKEEGNDGEPEKQQQSKMKVMDVDDDCVSDVDFGGNFKSMKMNENVSLERVIFEKERLNRDATKLKERWEVAMQSDLTCVFDPNASLASKLYKRCCDAFKNRFQPVFDVGSKNMIRGDLSAVYRRRKRNQSKRRAVIAHGLHRMDEAMTSKILVSPHSRKRRESTRRSGGFGLTSNHCDRNDHQTPHRLMFERNEGSDAISLNDSAMGGISGAERCEAGSRSCSRRRRSRSRGMSSVKSSESSSLSNRRSRVNFGGSYSSMNLRSRRDQRSGRSHRHGKRSDDGGSESNQSDASSQTRRTHRAAMLSAAAGMGTSDEEMVDQCTEPESMFHTSIGSLIEAMIGNDLAPETRLVTGYSVLPPTMPSLVPSVALFEMDEQQRLKKSPKESVCDPMEWLLKERQRLHAEIDALRKIAIASGVSPMKPLEQIDYDYEPPPVPPEEVQPRVIEPAPNLANIAGTDGILADHKCESVVMKEKDDHKLDDDAVTVDEFASPMKIKSEPVKIEVEKMPTPVKLNQSHFSRMRRKIINDEDSTDDDVTAVPKQDAVPVGVVVKDEPCMNSDNGSIESKKRKFKEMDQTSIIADEESENATNEALKKRRLNGIVATVAAAAAETNADEHSSDSPLTLKSDVSEDSEMKRSEKGRHFPVKQQDSRKKRARRRSNRLTSSVSSSSSSSSSVNGLEMSDRNLSTESNTRSVDPSENEDEDAEEEAERGEDEDEQADEDEELSNKTRRHHGNPPGLDATKYLNCTLGDIETARERDGLVRKHLEDLIVSSIMEHVGKVEPESSTPTRRSKSSSPRKHRGESQSHKKKKNIGNKSDPRSNSRKKGLNDSDSTMSGRSSSTVTNSNKKKNGQITKTVVTAPVASDSNRTVGVTTAVFHGRSSMKTPSESLTTLLSDTSASPVSDAADSSSMVPSLASSLTTNNLMPAMINQASSLPPTKFQMKMDMAVPFLAVANSNQRGVIADDSAPMGNHLTQPYALVPSGFGDASSSSILNGNPVAPYSGAHSSSQSPLMARVPVLPTLAGGSVCVAPMTLCSRMRDSNTIPMKIEAPPIVPVSKQLPKTAHIIRRIAIEPAALKTHGSLESGSGDSSQKSSLGLVTTPQSTVSKSQLHDGSDTLSMHCDTLSGVSPLTSEAAKKPRGRRLTLVTAADEAEPSELARCWKNKGDVTKQQFLEGCVGTKSTVREWAEYVRTDKSVATEKARKKRTHKRRLQYEIDAIPETSPELALQSAALAGGPSESSSSESGQSSLHSSVDGLLHYNSLGYREKALRFDKSSIHSWGMFAVEDIEPNEMVIEYIGEYIDNQTADAREKVYRRRGFDDYMFRFDPHTVIDATLKGNHARFINHSCDPNCVAKPIQVGGTPRVVIYSKKLIRAGEELTYDYCFAHEESGRIPCLCGATGCRGFLN